MRFLTVYLVVIFCLVFTFAFILASNVLSYSVKKKNSHFWWHKLGTLLGSIGGSLLKWRNDSKSGFSDLQLFEWRQLLLLRSFIRANTRIGVWPSKMHFISESTSFSDRNDCCQRSLHRYYQLNYQADLHRPGTVPAVWHPQQRIRSNNDKIFFFSVFKYSNYSRPCQLKHLRLPGLEVACWIDYQRYHWPVTKRLFPS